MVATKRTPGAGLGDPRKGTDGSILEVGGKAIYEFRSHPRMASWEDAAAETRASYRARMQELLNELRTAGYTVRRRNND